MQRRMYPWAQIPKGTDNMSLCVYEKMRQKGVSYIFPWESHPPLPSTGTFQYIKLKAEFFGSFLQTIQGILILRLKYDIRIRHQLSLGIMGGGWRKRFLRVSILAEVLWTSLELKASLNHRNSVKDRFFLLPFHCPPFLWLKNLLRWVKSMNDVGITPRTWAHSSSDMNGPYGM